MTNNTDATGRELPPGRYADFEGADGGEDLPNPLAGRLTPKKRAPAPTTQRKTSTATKRSTPTPPPPAPAPEQPDVDDEMRPSSLHVPSNLIGLIRADRNATGRTNGEILIAALEETEDGLPTYLRPQGTVGGSRFRSRGVRARPDDNDLTPVAVRLFTSDYAAIDDMVRELQARSRSHLAAAALRAYYDARQRSE